MWGRLRGGMGNLFTQTLSSAAGTGGVILGVNALSPNPPAQDFKNANLMAPKIQQSRSFINGNFDGSTTMILVCIFATFLMIGFVFAVNKCCNCVPSIGRRRKEMQERQITQIPQAMRHYQDNVMMNSQWPGMAKQLGFCNLRAVDYDQEMGNGPGRGKQFGFHGSRKVDYDRNIGEECGLEASLVRAETRKEKRREGKEMMEGEEWEVVVERGREKGEDLLQAVTAPKTPPRMIRDM